MERERVTSGPDLPRVNYGGQDWNQLEDWLSQKLYEVYKHLAKPDTTWEQTLAYRGQASFIEKMLDLRNIAGTLGTRE